MKENTVDILGVRFDQITADSLDELSSKPGQHAMYTPNAEMLVCAARDDSYRHVLNRASLNLCDGSGPAYLARIFQQKKVFRVSGSDYFLELLTWAARHDKTVYLLGTGDRKVLEKTAARINTDIPGISIVGMHPGVTLDIAEKGSVQTLVFDRHAVEELLADINHDAPDILLVAFGHPKQELFIDMFLRDMPSVQIAMGVGGSLDFYAGKVRRAPKWLRKIGLESLWRLALEPWRYKRVFTALIIFPILYIKHYVTKKR